ncbi:MAG: hypothetical protein IT365_21615 [Candidatus Hydrogenedentes bacterium]|nr:hypothetical protein [Candidatus Hydrogenedentota bacterium]
MGDNDNPQLDLAEYLTRQKFILLAVMLLLSGVFGVLDSVFASTPGWAKSLFMLDTLSFMFCLLLWCGCDAQLRGFTLGRGLRWTIFLIALVGFPIYAFKSRGRNGWSLVLLGALFFLMLAVVSAGAGCLTDVVRGEPD